MALRIRSANRDLMRRTNEALVLGIVHDFGPSPARRSPKNPTQSRRHLQHRRLPDRARHRDGRKPRRIDRRPPPHPLVINRSAAVVIGVKLTQEQAVVALTDLGAELVEQLAVRSEPIFAHHGYRHPRPPRRRASRRAFRSPLSRSRRRHGRHHRPPAGRLPLFAFLQWRDIPVRQLLEERVGMPVIVENDVNTLALAERWFGAGAVRRTSLWSRSALASVWV